MFVSIVTGKIEITGFELKKDCIPRVDRCRKLEKWLE
jgi:hypothetical protein